MAGCDTCIGVLYHGAASCGADGYINGGYCDGGYCDGGCSNDINTRYGS